MPIYTDILKELRKEKHMTQTDIAKQLWMSQRMYSYYESGQREMRISMLEQLAEILETSTDYILGRTSVKTPYPKRK